MENIEVYSNNIVEAISQYCIDKDVSMNDLYNFDQCRWNSVLLYIYNYTFKPLKNSKTPYNCNSNINYDDIDLLRNVLNIYINICYEYSKEISILGFSKMTGINPDTIYTWGHDESGRGVSEIYKTLNREREESLSSKLVSNKGNPVGLLGVLNRHYNWNMGQPRTLEVKQAAPAIPDLERKYLTDAENTDKQFNK